MVVDACVCVCVGLEVEARAGAVNGANRDKESEKEIAYWKGDSGRMGISHLAY